MAVTLELFSYKKVDLLLTPRALTNLETQPSCSRWKTMAPISAYGRNFLVNTDHKPLKAIAKKTLDRAPKCLRKECFLESLPTALMSSTQHLADMMS